jgi:hypothetical protein
MAPLRISEISPNETNFHFHKYFSKEQRGNDDASSNETSLRILRPLRKLQTMDMKIRFWLFLEGSSHKDE